MNGFELGIGKNQVFLKPKIITFIPFVVKRIV